MSNRPLLISLFLIIVMLALSGCSPTCDPDSMQIPQTTSPTFAALVDASGLTLEWSYPTEGCVPENFEITVFQNDNMGNPIFVEEVAHTARSITLPTLDEVSYYSWQVRAKVGTTYSEGLGDMSNFITGPVCDPSDQPEPELVSPDMGGIMYDVSPLLVWDYPATDCIPEGYLVELSVQQDFSDTSLNFQTDVPIKIKDIGHLLQPNTKYFWRVSAVADGVIGDTSWYRYFYTEPVCDAAELVPPLLTSPFHLSTVDRLSPWFDWQDSYQNCTPDGFHLKVSEFEDFSTLAIDHLSPQSYTPRFYLAAPLEDCKSYYWQLAPSSSGLLGPYSDISNFYTLVGDCPCDPDHIHQPELGYPGGENWISSITIVPDLHPTLEWNYPGSCIPDEYQVYLSKDIRFQDTSLNAKIPGEESPTYSPPQLLQPATQYWWLTSAVLDGKVGPTPRPGSFFTGPECGSIADVAAPALIEPENGAVVRNLPWYLKYGPGEPGCIPDGYDINLQTAPDFSGNTLVGSFDVPSTRINLGINLENCLYYYWKVAAIQDGTYSDESEIRSFFMDLEGNCPIPFHPGTTHGSVLCEEGPGWPVAKYIFEDGDPIQIVSKNKNGDYLEVYVPDETGLVPAEPPDTCWVPSDQVDTDIPFSALPVKVPPAQSDSSGGDSGGSGPSCVMTKEQCDGYTGIWHPYPECWCELN